MQKEQKQVKQQNQPQASQSHANLTSNLEITSLELDAIKETANIGTGNASIALSNIFKKKVSISLPSLELSTPSEISRVVAGPKEMVVGIYSKILDGMDGNIVMMMPTKSAISITSVISRRSDNSETIVDKDKLVLQKFGTAVYASYLTSLAKFFEKKITFAPPNVISTFGESVLDFILLHVGQVDKVLVIKLGFTIEETGIKGDFILLFTLDSLKPLLSNIHKKIG